MIYFFKVEIRTIRICFVNLNIYFFLKLRPGQSGYVSSISTFIFLKLKSGQSGYGSSISTFIFLISISDSPDMVRQSQRLFFFKFNFRVIRFISSISLFGDHRADCSVISLFGYPISLFANDRAVCSVIEQCTEFPSPPPPPAPSTCSCTSTASRSPARSRPRFLA